MEITSDKPGLFDDIFAGMMREAEAREASSNTIVIQAPTKPPQSPAPSSDRWKPHRRDRFGDPLDDD